MASTDDAHSSGRSADGHFPRQVADPATGRSWSVGVASWEWPPTGPPSDCLIFDRGDLVRRVWPVPDDWRGMRDEALLALMERRPGR